MTRFKDAIDFTFALLKGKPTTLAGFGITDAASDAELAAHAAVVASDLVSGHVKVDGTTVTIASGVISAAAGGGAPSGPAGGVLGGTYPNPGFAADMATQAELDAHAALTTSAHGGIVASTDSRLTDSRTPLAHAIGGALHTGSLTDALHGSLGGGALHPAVIAAGANGFMTGADKTKLDGVASGATANVGTVTSVDLTVPGLLFSVAGNPITGAGTLALSLLTQTANRFLAGPASGGAATPTVRAIVQADLGSGSGGAGTKALYDDLTWKTVSGGGSIDGSGAAGRIAEWVDSDTLQSSTLIKSGAGVLTLDASGAFTLTVPASLTPAGLAIANVFTLAQTAQRDAIGATTTDGLVLANATAAAAGAQQWSPRLRLTGQGWKTTATAASQTVDWIAELVPVQGTTAPSSKLVFSSQVNGGGYAQMVAFDQGQNAAAGPVLNIGTAANNGIGLGGGNQGTVSISASATEVVRFTSTNGILLAATLSMRWGIGTGTLALKQNASTALEVNNGTSGQWQSILAGVRDTNLSTVVNGLTLGHQISTGTVAAGHGIGILLNLASDTAGTPTNDQNAAQIAARWPDTAGATHATRTGALSISTVSLAGALAERARFDSGVVAGSAVAGNTGMMLWDVDNNTLERITVGAADSGGTGFKLLRIPN